VWVGLHGITRTNWIQNKASRRSINARGNTLWSGAYKVKECQGSYGALVMMPNPRPDEKTPRECSVISLPIQKNQKGQMDQVITGPKRDE